MRNLSEPRDLYGSHLSPSKGIRRRLGFLERCSLDGSRPVDQTDSLGELLKKGRVGSVIPRLTDPPIRELRTVQERFLVH